MCRYWSRASQSCLDCPLNYKSGYGNSIQGSQHPITNRCYRVATATVTDYATAQSSCGTNGNLITIRNILEMSMVKIQMTGGIPHRV